MEDTGQSHLVCLFMRESSVHLSEGMLEGDGTASLPQELILSILELEAECGTSVDLGD